MAPELRPAGQIPLMPKVDKDAPEILIVFFDAVVEAADMFLVEEAQHPFLQLPTALPRDDLDQVDALVHRFLDDPVELLLNRFAAIVKLMQIELQLCHPAPCL